MAIWRPFYLHCESCGHRNQPAKSPREGVRLVLLGHTGNCRGCGASVQPHAWELDRPLVQKVREQLRTEGLTPVY